MKIIFFPRKLLCEMRNNLFQLKNEIDRNNIIFILKIKLIFNRKKKYLFQ